MYLTSNPANKLIENITYRKTDRRTDRQIYINTHANRLMQILNTLWKSKGRKIQIYILIHIYLQFL